MARIASTDGGPGTMRPGGRTERNRQAVAGAVLEILRSGDADLSPARVAEVAGVGVSTVYRRWPTRAALVAEALSEHTRSLRVPDTGAFDDDVRRLARTLARFFSDPGEIALSAAMVAAGDPDFAELQIDYWNAQASELAQPFSAAIERGELDPEVDAPALVEMLIAPLVVRTVILKQSLPRSFVDGLAEQVIRAARA